MVVYASGVIHAIRKCTLQAFKSDLRVHLHRGARGRIRGKIIHSSCDPLSSTMNRLAGGRWIRVSCPNDVGVASLGHAWLTVLWGRVQVTIGGPSFIALSNRRGKHYVTFDANRYEKAGRKKACDRLDSFSEICWLKWILFRRKISSRLVVQFL